MTTCRRCDATACACADLRLGRWQDVLADVEMVDAVVCDPPYSARTHEGQRTGTSTRTPTIAYEPMTEAGAFEIAASWAPRTRYWAVVWSDHTAAVWHESAWRAHGWYVFAPIAYVKDTYAPRLSGDGPALGAEWITVARPQARIPSERTGSRPGWYLARGRRSCDPKSGIAGMKDIGAVSDIVSDYTLPGDLVCDPFAGSGTTLRACFETGRRSIGAEMDPDTYALAQDRLRGLGPMRKPQGNLFEASVADGVKRLAGRKQ